MLNDENETDGLVISLCIVLSISIVCMILKIWGVACCV